MIFTLFAQRVGDSIFYPGKAHQNESQRQSTQIFSNGKITAKESSERIVVDIIAPEASSTRRSYWRARINTIEPVGREDISTTEAAQNGSSFIR